MSREIDADEWAKRWHESFKSLLHWAKKNPVPEPPESVTLEYLEERFNTVGAFWHDVYAQWEVRCDNQRRTWNDCRIVGWGDTLSEACSVALRSCPDTVETVK